MASPSVVRRSMPRAVASTSLSMLLNAIAKPIDTDTLAPAPANDAASAAAPAIATGWSTSVPSRPRNSQSTAHINPMAPSAPNAQCQE